MTEVLHSSSQSSSPSVSTSTHNGSLFHQSQSYVDEEGVSGVAEVDREDEENSVKEKRENERDQLSLLALLLTLFRKSFWLACKKDREELCGGDSDKSMEIGWPTDVQHVNHVTFDRFDGFLGLPVEFEPEVPRRAPSASATVFGVSTESMQLSYDARGNSVPTILLLMQRHLYAEGGLQSEGIFRINAENSQEEYVRDQLNRGVVPEGIDVHCLAGLIKAWFRELPRGVLDSLSPEQVIQCQSEEDCAALVRLLPPTEAALLDWAVNLMADVVQEEHQNKMNARNIAMVFAPNMTQMADPLTALMYAVQVMNFLKALIEKTLRERQDSLANTFPTPHMEPSNDNGHEHPGLLHLESSNKTTEETEETYTMKHPNADNPSRSNQVDNLSDEEYLSYSTSGEESDESVALVSSSSDASFLTTAKESTLTYGPKAHIDENTPDSKTAQSSVCDLMKPDGKVEGQDGNLAPMIDTKSKGILNLSCINSKTERIEAWR